MRKLVFCIADGMADVPAQCERGITPMRAARTPVLDSMVRHCVAGLCHVIPPALPPDSDVGNMALLGYDPVSLYCGRAPLEALGSGVAHVLPASAPGMDLADALIWRLSLVRLRDTPQGPVMDDAQGGGIGAEEGKRTAQRLAAVLAAADARFTLHPDTAYRHILVQRGWQAAPAANPPAAGPMGTMPAITVPSAATVSAAPASAMAASGTVPPGVCANGPEGPHRLLGQPVTAHRAALPSEVQGALRLMEEELRAMRGPANGVWLWGQGVVPRWPSFAALHGLAACMVTGISLLRGLGRAAGMHVAEDTRFTGLPGTDLRAKAEAALRFLRPVSAGGMGGDAAFIHVDAPDHCAHQGDAQGKRAAVEAIDRDLLAPLRQALPDAVFVITCDHITCAATRTHERGAVPFLIHAAGADAMSACPSFCELGCRGGRTVSGGPALLELARSFM
ncbi:hypothetical protein [Desulfovibrio psychrotolerans]|uniref:Phosphonopyruvate decarboxylase n=1 Tax=Desulfovibrio psychrotolerans TaxID=415242 RepID=A0A7J0BU55_9BACT|nr:hypothetical protein [Desulfovibrio psychrotolerans]GFM37233.1 phosphonopyruvate decarboxylase [Desulfovibrio psychrotolerans]